VAEAIKAVIDRLQLELAVIEKTGFISYFLIVARLRQLRSQQGHRVRGAW
jgi:DNA polymerase III alpha subunit